MFCPIRKRESLEFGGSATKAGPLSFVIAFLPLFFFTFLPSHVLSLHSFSTLPPFQQKGIFGNSSSSVNDSNNLNRVQSNLTLYFHNMLN